MGSDSVRYELEGRVATIRIDDGKRNALSLAVLRSISDTLERAKADRAAVVFTGREDVFSAGFDLNVMKRGGPDALRMLGAGYALPAKVMNHPYPVVTACNGHVLAMGVFLMLSSDYVVGSRGDFRVSANEVAIGLPMPRVAATVLRHRLTPAAFQRAVTLAEYFDAESAMAAGFFDALADPADVLDRAKARAVKLLELDPRAHRISKQRIRARVTRQLKLRRPLDLAEAVWLGIRGGKPR